MILNVSGRTDIVAFYSEWFMNRYKEGFVDVRNPFNPSLISRIYFEDVDAIMFCSKNPLPIIDYLEEIKKPIIFHITLTGYKRDIEKNVPNKKEIIEGIKKISKIIGIDRVFVRYDPVLINEEYTVEYHIKAFDKLCEKLNGYVKNIIISFIDDYKNVQNNMNILKLKTIDNNDLERIGICFSDSAKRHNMMVQTCAEDDNLTEYGFTKNDCLSQRLAFEITGKDYKIGTIRKGTSCNCVETVDIGYYNSCPHMCAYCYANYNEKEVKTNYLNHDKTSSLLIGKIAEKDIIKRRNK